MGPTEIVLILAAVLLLFGGKKLPGLARSMGRAVSEFRHAKDTITREADNPEELLEKLGKAFEEQGPETEKKGPETEKKGEEEKKEKDVETKENAEQ